MPENKPVYAENVPTRVGPENARGQLSHDEIARHAEQLWRERGSPTGRDDEIWLAVEAELMARSESKPVAGTPSRPYVDEPAKPLRSRTKVQDPSESAAQTRSATESRSRGSAGKLRNQ